LANLADNQKSYSVVNTHKVSIIQTLIACGNSGLNNSALITRVMKGIFNCNPPMPRYACTWDTSVLLTYLRSLYPLSSLSLKLITWKTAALVALVTAQRAQTVLALDLRYMTIKSDRIVFEIRSLLKGSRPGKPNPPVELLAFTEPSLCVKRTLIHYVNRTKSVRKSMQLFVSFRSGQPVCTSTVARWIRGAMEESGVDVAVFKAHSLRGAASSKAWTLGVKLQDILSTASWAKEKTFADFYNRKILSDFPVSRSRFADAILSSK
jgi:hypothetical protein